MGNRIYFVGWLGLGGDRNRMDQVERGGIEGKEKGRTKMTKKKITVNEIISNDVL